MYKYAYMHVAGKFGKSSIWYFSRLLNVTGPGKINHVGTLIYFKKHQFEILMPHNFPVAALYQYSYNNTVPLSNAIKRVWDTILKVSKFSAI